MNEDKLVCKYLGSTSCAQTGNVFFDDNGNAYFTYYPANHLRIESPHKIAKIDQTGTIFLDWHGGDFYINAFSHAEKEVLPIQNGKMFIWDAPSYFIELATMDRHDIPAPCEMPRSFHGRLYYLTSTENSVFNKPRTENSFFNKLRAESVFSGKLFITPYRRICTALYSYDFMNSVSQSKLLYEVDEYHHIVGYQSLGDSIIVFEAMREERQEYDRVVLISPETRASKILDLDNIDNIIKYGTSRMHLTVINNYVVLDNFTTNKTDIKLYDNDLNLVYEFMVDNMIVHHVDQECILSTYHSEGKVVLAKRDFRTNAEIWSLDIPNAIHIEFVHYLSESSMLLVATRRKRGMQIMKVSYATGEIIDTVGLNVGRGYVHGTSSSRLFIVSHNEKRSTALVYCVVLQSR